VKRKTKTAPLTESAETPRAAGFAMPAEWERHAACWLAWPHAADLWLENLAAAQEGFVALARGIADPDPKTGAPRGEALSVLVPSAREEATAREALGSLPVRFHHVPTGDIWLRDTAPVFVVGPRGEVGAVRFAFNGWGKKYVLPHDDAVAERIAALSGKRTFAFAWVLEGGSVEVDGEGTCLTTRQCLLNPNRNPGMNGAAIEAGLRDALGCEKVLWLEDGLLNDHTDGHIDTLARFVAPGVVLCMEPRRADDPNRAVLEAIRRALGSMKDARGRKLEVLTVPSPGRVLDDSDLVMPASYVNFYIANTTVVVPQYGVPADEEAVRRVAEAFPQRRAVGAPAKAILAGGGAFHCITQQEPRGRA
jgi:agmatine deiminase